VEIGLTIVPSVGILRVRFYEV